MIIWPFKRDADDILPASVLFLMEINLNEMACYMFLYHWFFVNVQENLLGPLIILIER
jgi:hypothetical protein